MKKFLTRTFVILFSLAVIALAVGSYWQYRKKPVQKVDVRLHHAKYQAFINRKQVLQAIHSADSVKGRPISKISVAWMEKQIQKNPFVKSADAYLNIDGDLVIHVFEKKALLRVYNSRKQSCYLDDRGQLFPLTPMVSARVIPVNGYIKNVLVPGKMVTDSLYQKSVLPGLYRLALQIDSNPFLKAAISQIFVTSRGEVDFVPELGSHIVHFGKLEDINIKLENLEAFYKQALIKEGWNKYNRINLAFTNQVVCTKK